MKKISSLLFYSLFVLVSLGQIGRVSLFGQQINAYLYELPLIALMFVLVLRYKHKPLIFIKEKLPSLGIFITYLAVVFVLTVFQYSFTSNVISSLYLLRLGIYFSFFVYLWFHLKKQPEFKATLFKGLIIFSVLTFLFSVVQYFLYSNLRNISYLGWDPHWFRMVGTFLDPPITGAVFGLVALYFFYEKNIPLAFRFSTITTFILCLVLTYSRGTYLAGFFTALVVFFRKKLILGLFVAGSLAVLIFMVGSRPQGESLNLLRTFSIFSRFDNYQEALITWEKNPIIGVGYNRIRYSRPASEFSSQTDLEENHAGASYHSSFLIILVSGGVIGLGLFILLLFEVARLNIFARNGVIFLSLLSLTDNVLFHPFVLCLFLIMILRSFSLFDTSP